MRGRMPVWQVIGRISVGLAPVGAHASLEDRAADRLLDDLVERGADRLDAVLLAEALEQLLLAGFEARRALFLDRGEDLFQAAFERRFDFVLDLRLTAASPRTPSSACRLP